MSITSELNRELKDGKKVEGRLVWNFGEIKGGCPWKETQMVVHFGSRVGIFN